MRRVARAVNLVRPIRRLLAPRLDLDGRSSGGSSRQRRPAERGATYRLRYTGRLDAASFHGRCAEFDNWYHSYYFDNGFAVRGDYDIGADIRDYGFPEDMRGMTVLDVGTGSGWFAFYFAQHGADVTALDVRGYCDFDVYGRPEYPPISSEGRPPDRVDDEGRPIWYSPVSEGFWIMREILETPIQFMNARVYDIGPELFDRKRFDLVFLGALLLHLRDPIGALMAVHSVCRGRVVASTPVMAGEDGPGVAPRQYLPFTSIDRISWWLPNRACFEHWFNAAGFHSVDVSRVATLRCDVEHRTESGRLVNGDQPLRVGHALVASDRIQGADRGSPLAGNVEDAQRSAALEVEASKGARG